MWSTSYTPLQTNQSHIWKIHVPSTESHREHFITLLSDDEKSRVNRFKFEKDRQTYITAKGVLRTLIGYYLTCDPKSVVFQYNKQGKPSVESGIGLKFNVSHARELVLIGFSLHHDIGIDIEFNKRSVEIRSISKRFFSNYEAETLMALPKKDWQVAFYNCWTRKEAFIKAKGGGLSIPLDQFEVTLVPKEKPALKFIRWDQEDVPNWDLNAFNCGEDYTCAVMVHHPYIDYIYLDWKNFIYSR